MVERAKKQLSFWQKELGLEDHEIILEKVSPRQVFDADIKRIKGRVCAVDFDGSGKVVIFHTDPLKQGDIIHELLHFVHWDWDEERVRHETFRLIGRE